MSHQKELIFLLENVSNFSILRTNSPSMIRINEGRQYNLNHYRINSFSLSADPVNLIISKGFSINFDRNGENIKNSAKKNDSSTFQENSSQKDSKNKKINNLKKKHNKVNKSHKKELRKNNKENSKKAEKKITLIRPKMFEDESPPIKNNKNIIQKKEEELKTFKQVPNTLNKINFTFTNFINNDLTKKINIINQKNILKMPTIPLNENKITNNFINNSTINPDYKLKLFPPKPLNTFNVLKFTTNENTSKDEKLNLSNQNTSNISGPIENKNPNESKNFCVKYINTRKGRKSKKSKKNYYESKHTKFSEDNMMRKIKNKIIESSRLLTNKLFFDELKIINENYYFCCKEFRKIKGSFSQELNIKFNLYFYLMKIKEIFSLELSHKYTAIENNTNKELIDYIFSEQNDNYFTKTKLILNMPFHQYYHDIFLNENKNWKSSFGIDDNDDRYQIGNLLKSLEEKIEENDNIENNNIYAQNINTLAHHYEDFFLSKKTRNVELGNKKEDCIKLFMETTTDEQYKYYLDQLKQFKNYYETRSGIKDQPKVKSPFILKYNFIKTDNLKINEINKINNIDNNNINNNNFDNLTVVKFKIDTAINKPVNNKENENKLNTPQKKPEILFKVDNLEKENNFCGKKRKLDEEDENSEKKNNVEAIEI